MGATIAVAVTFGFVWLIFINVDEEPAMIDFGRPAFSPDGERLYFGYCYAEEPCGIAVYEFLSGEFSAYYHDGPEYWGMPTVSPDERSVAILTDTTPDKVDNQIAILDLETRQAKPLTDEKFIHYDYINYAEDGKSIFFTKRNFGGNRAENKGFDEIYSIDLETGAERRVTNERYDYISRLNYLGGSRFIFSTERTTTRPSIPDGIYDLDLSIPSFEAIIVDTDQESLWPVVSRDGTILFVAVEGHISESRTELYRWRDGETKRITNRGVWLQEPAISPAGDKGVFVRMDKRYARETRQLWVIDIDTGLAKQIPLPVERITPAQRGRPEN